MKNKKALAFSLTAAFVGSLAVAWWSKEHEPVSAARPELRQNEALPAVGGGQAPREPEPLGPSEDRPAVAAPPSGAEPRPEAPVAETAAPQPPLATAPVELERARAKSPEEVARDKATGLRKSEALLGESLAWLKQRRAALGAGSPAAVAVLERRIGRLERRLELLGQGRDPDEGLAVPKN
jgi:hypothetical protein